MMMEESTKDVPTTYSNDIVMSDGIVHPDHIDHRDSDSSAHDGNVKRKFDGTARILDVASNSKEYEVGADKKRTKVDDNAASVTSEYQQSEPTSVRIKLEPVDCVESAKTSQADESCAVPTKECGSCRAETTSAENSNPSQAMPNLVKTEYEDESPTVSNDNGNNVTEAVSVKPEIKVEVAAANPGSNVRASCRFGIRCYRANPVHRSDEAHPGDQDYRRPIYPTPPLGTPACRFGNACYRRNPTHFAQFAHPPDTDFAQNYLNYQRVLRQRPLGQPLVNIPNHSDDDYDFDDDSGSDFEPDEGVETDLEEAE